MNVQKFLTQCVEEVIAEPIGEAKLRCSVCGGNAKGKQWPNQDKGYGICGRCAAKMKADGKENIEQSYGREGTHYFIGESSWNNDEPTQYRTYTTDGEVWYAHFNHDKHKEIPGMIILPYTRIHVPDGNRQYEFVAVYNKNDFDKLLAHWNKQQPAKWNYVAGHDDIKEANATQFIKECVLEVLMESLSKPNDSASSTFDYEAHKQAGIEMKSRWNKDLEDFKARDAKAKANIEAGLKSSQERMDRMKRVGELKKRLQAMQADPSADKVELANLEKEYRKESVWLRNVLHSAGYGYQSRPYLREGGFDPQSQAGPNAPQENPYPEWNSQMAKMEEDAVPNQPQHKVEIKPIDFHGEAYYTVFIDGQEMTANYPGLPVKSRDIAYDIADEILATLDESDSHGRYAQEAGAGQFDPRTFGPVAESAIQWQCPHCKQSDKIPFQTFKGKPRIK